MTLRKTTIAAALGTVLLASAMTAISQQPGAMMGGPGAGQGRPGAGMMGGQGDYGTGPGMMGGYGGYGMGPGMMGGYGGYGMGPGMMGGYGGYGMGPGMMGGYGANLGAMDLSAEQREKITRIHESLSTKHWELMGKIQEQQFKLRELMASGKADDASVGKAYKRVVELRQQMWAEAAEMHKQLDAVLTPAQREQLQRGWKRDGN